MSRRTRDDEKIMEEADEEGEHVDSSGEEEDEDEDEDPDEDFELRLEDLLGGVGLDSFMHEFWGKKVMSTTIDPSLLDNLQRGLFRGDLEQIVRTCRKDDNSQFSGQEIEDFESQLEENRRTVNLPFCFAKSAVALKQAFIATPGAPGNDIEVGVYISRGGGEPAAWHFDNNHNITIQIYGFKDWLYTPGPPLAMASRALTDPPQDAVAQSRPIPCTSRASPAVRCISLRPGSVLYVPPGHWHSVIPAIGERSLAMDLRVATIPRAKWIAEALFAATALAIRGDAAAHGGGWQRGEGEWDAAVGWGTGEASALAVVLGEEDWAASSRASGGSGGSAEDEGCALVRRSVGAALRWCKPPRALPFEEEHSDGMQLGGRLAFLRDQVGAGWSRAELEPKKRVRVNPMVTVGVKERSDGGAVLCLRSLSSLTSSEYMRYDLVCSASMLPIARVLSTQRCATVGKLAALVPQPGPEQGGSGKKRKKLGGGEGGEHEQALGELRDLLEALSFANVLVIGRAAAAEVASSSSDSSSAREGGSPLAQGSSRTGADSDKAAATGRTKSGGEEAGGPPSTASRKKKAKQQLARTATGIRDQP